MKMPFDSHPGKGRRLLGERTGASCRREYGHRLQRLTGQARVNSDLDLAGTFGHLLIVSVDDAIPTETGKVALAFQGAVGGLHQLGLLLEW